MTWVTMNVMNIMWDMCTQNIYGFRSLNTIADYMIIC